MRLLILDNVDSFTYTLVDYLTQAGAECHVMRNTEPLADITRHPYHGVVLSPGPGTPAASGCLLAVLGHYYRKLPVLGVCLGHQAIGQFFGATLGNSQRPMHGHVSTIAVDGTDPLFANVPERFGVTRYHSLTLTNLPATLAQTATCQTDTPGEIMAIRHRQWPIWGVQFHPEAHLTEFGLPILRNYIQAIKTVHPL